MLKVLLIMILTATGAAAQQPTPVELILQQTIAQCAGESARALARVQQLSARVQELERKLEQASKDKPESESKK